jgi:T5orf172 domain
MSEGIVYILKNEAMPGYVKIGLTQQNDVADRVKQLDNTSVPVAFELFFAARVPDCRKAERTLHFVFGEKRARNNREFFTIDPNLAKAIIELVSIDELALSDADQAIDQSERKEIEKLKRKKVRTFDSLNIPIGETLTFVKDEEITCTVAGSRKVIFRDQEISASAAALKVIHGMGYTWPAVSGMEYWAYKGIRLTDIGTPDVEEYDD